jgi:uncharacterized protein
MKLTEFFKEHPKVAVAFSGGVDSSYLLYAAKKSGSQVHAYYVKSAFQPQFELDDAKRLAKDISIDMTILPVDILQKDVISNPSNRCYYCKRDIFQTIMQQAHQDGYTVLLDGTNASDDSSDRPGMVALKELSVLSPLRLCGLTKAEIRRRSKEAGLFTWNKPAYACLATRIPTGHPITSDILERTEWAENYLFSLGFTDFRVRLLENSARLQFPKEQLEQVLQHRKQIVQTLKTRYDHILLDLEVRHE